jgi:hypothetical protein
LLAGPRWSSGFLLFSLADACRAGEAHYMLLFGAQRPHGRPKYTHTWATFVRATGTGPYPSAPALEWHTISWLPRSLDVEVTSLLPEPGVNLDLYATLKFVLGHDERVFQWGPFCIDKILYERALAHISHLESGQARYKAADSAYPTRRVSNCFHAVGDLAEGQPRIRVGSPAWGELATYLVARQLRPWILNSHEEHHWLEGPLGLEDYPITHRNLDQHLLTQRRQEARAGRYA